MRGGTLNVRNVPRKLELKPGRGQMPLLQRRSTDIFELGAKWRSMICEFPFLSTLSN
jgi:hypothetical protein